MTANGLRLAVERITVETRFRSSTSEFEADADEMFVFGYIETNNEGDEPQSLPAADEFAIVAEGQQHGPFGDPSIQPPDSVEGDMYTGGEQRRSGVGDEGWLMFAVPRAVGGAVLSWFDETGVAEELRWNLDLDEHVSDLPQVEFAEFVLPETATVGEAVELAFELENTGGRTGEVHLLLVVDGPVRDEAELNVTVPPGERTRVSKSYTVDEPGELVVTVHPFERTERVLIEE